MNEIIKMENVGFVYDETVTALSGVDFCVNKGEYIVVLGHNGSGKSTFAKLLNGLLLPTSGKVFVDGFDTSEKNEIWEVRKRAGMVFQNPDNQIVATTVEEDVAFGLENIGVPTEQMQGRIDAALEEVSMSEYKQKEPHMLSGGQKQRVAIAGILAMYPDIVILDEATAMLDPKGRKDVLAMIDKLNHEMGKTIIHITHYMEQALFADRAIVLNEGKIVLDDLPINIFSNPLIKKIGLDVPGVIELEQLLQPEFEFGGQTDFEKVAKIICQSL